MRRHVLVILQLGAFVMLSPVSYAGRDGTFTEAGSILLFRDETLRLTTGQREVIVPNPPGTLVEGSVPIPALASNGDRVAVELVLPETPPGGMCKTLAADCLDHGEQEIKSVVGVYSLRDKSWKLFGDFCPDEVSSVALSTDGTKVAFTSKSKKGSLQCSDNPTVLEILDIATGEFTTVPYPGETLMGDSPLSWSPDGRYLVGQLGSMETSTQHVALIEIASGKGKTIAEGTAPSWSPKGDWIAYVVAGPGGQKCMLIRPDGTDLRMIYTPANKAGPYSILYRSAVWSPDGRELMFNEMKADEPSVRVTKLDLTTGTVTTEARDGLIVFGWGRESNRPPDR